jgi:hypothetical protein
VRRNIEKAQIAVELVNAATFPISCFLETADTELEGIKPPRSDFPKPKTLLLPGNKVRISDDPIDMDEHQSGPIAGKMNFIIKYGLPNKEYFEICLRANLVTQMTDFGLVTSVAASWLE